MKSFKNPFILAGIQVMILLLAVNSFAQDDPPPPKTVTTELAPGIYQIYYNNVVSLVAFTGPDGLMLVDDGYKKSADVIREELKKISADSLRFILNTHWHGDHTGGNIPLGKGTHIIAHEQVKEMLNHDQVSLGSQAPAFPSYAQPDITFTDRLSVYFNGDTVKLIHLPGGHTGGDAIVWFPKGKVLVMGDLIFADNFPYVDLEHGGNAVKYVDNLNWVIQHLPEDITIVPGHGRIYTMTDFKAWQSALQKTIELIIDQQAQGLSAGDMKQKKILSDYAGFGKWWITEDQWIDAVVKSLN